MKHAAHKVWHEAHSAEVLEWLGVEKSVGLSMAEVVRRQDEFGHNKVSARNGRPPWLKFLQQFQQPLIYILLIAAGVTAFLGEWVDSSVIFGVVLINSIVGFIQESKAEKAIESLSQMVTTEATVRRDGRRERIHSEQLVPGDIVVLEAGDRVPADLRLFEVRNLHVDESALTGESAPVSKHGDPLKFDTLLADRKNLAFAGTLVTAGQAEGVAWATGDRTEAGRIAWLISEAVELQTPLTRKIAQFSRLLVWVILGLAFVAFAVGVARGGDVLEMFMAAVALAVGAIPEGLPAAVTIVLAIGVARMARRRAIIRKLPAVETLGSTTVICSDKTGTLTENQMTVRKILAGGQLFEVTGAGYDAAGTIHQNGEITNTEQHPALLECLRAGVLCNDSQLGKENGRTKVQGDPTEAALLISAEKGGLHRGELISKNLRLDMIPFESGQMFRATLHQNGTTHVIYKVGAVERLLDDCTDALGPTGQNSPLNKAEVLRAVEQMAAHGLRVLAFTRRHAPTHQFQLHHSDVNSALTFIGLQAMIDPPRPEAVAAVRQCQSAGVAVKMITGDHLTTAIAIACQIGLSGSQADKLITMTGRDLGNISDANLPELAEGVTVFARVAPEQKLRLVRALQARHHVVAMTGDGVNDAPALKQANIGIAMGIGGTDVAKGAADMILTDDNFASIEAAVEEGRGVFDNLTKFIVWTLPTNVGQSLIILASILTGLALPALPVQLLWVNMTTSVFLGLALAFEPRESNLMARPPRDPRKPILTFPLFMRTGLVSLIMLAGAFGLFYWEHGAEGRNLSEARTAVVNVIVMVQAFYLLNSRSLSRSIFSIGVFSNRWIWLGLAGMAVAQLLFTYVPFMNQLFHTAPVRGEAWLYIAATAVAAYAVVEFEKWVRFGIGRQTG